MTEKRASDNAYIRLHLQADDLMSTLAYDFKAGKTLSWPVVRKAQLCQVWGDFVAHGTVRDEMALDRIFDSMSDSLCHLLVANLVSGHEQTQPADYLEDHLEPELQEPFCDWLITDESGYWRISDYGTAPLLHAMALASEARTLPEKLKYLDRALHVVHMRGDLSRLFVEGGRDTVLHVGLETACEA